jgi:hypothetical protein
MGFMWQGDIETEKVKTSDSELEHILLFLDDHFDNHDVDKDPAKKAINILEHLGAWSMTSMWKIAKNASQTRSI